MIGAAIAGDNGVLARSVEVLVECCDGSVMDVRTGCYSESRFKKLRQRVRE